MWKEAKYLIAYVTPLAAFFAIYQGGWWSYGALVVAFMIIPTLEIILPPRPENLTDEIEADLSSRKFFDWLLYFNLPIVYFLCIVFALEFFRTTL